MKFLRYVCLFMMLIVMAGSTSPVFAQNYRFQVPEEAVVVYVNVDGSISIDYTMKFVNDPGAHAIDIIDIGLPNYNYELNSITAEIDGKKISRITASDYVQPGISLYLKSDEIPAGGSGTVHVFIPVVKDVIYPATQDEAEVYASIVFTPSWFGSEYVHGKTDLQATILLPPGVLESEGRFFLPDNWPGSTEPESQLLDNGRIYYTWVSDQANVYSVYTFGASFPSRLLDEGAVVLEPYVPPSQTGSSNSGFDSDLICPLIFCLGFVGFFGIVIYSATVGAKKRKMKYLPPKILIEGNGVKRGLTSVEAGVLMEQPMDKIFTMILFSLLKKGAVEVVTKDPLDLKVSTPLPEGLYGYENEFLAAFGEKGNARKKLLQTTMVNLIRSVTEKMKGFSRKETLAYYENIMKKAWAQVEEANTPEVKAQVYEDVMDWTMLDRKYDDRTRDVFSGPAVIPAPMWWWRYDPTFTRPSVASAGKISSPPAIGSTVSRPSISMPTIPGSSFAASVVNSVSSFSTGILGGLTGFSNSVTKVTNPPPPPSTYRSSSSGRSSGGGGSSCACACACAGCACACAGGGR